MKTKLSAAALLLALYLPPARADVVFADPPHWKQLHEGETAYLNRDYRRALQILLPLADNGDYTVRSIVQPKLAQIYVLGPEGVKNPAEAARWLHKAAEGGDIGSQYYLGLLYLRGRDRDFDIKPDAAQAAKWFAKAAEQGHTDAALTLASIYEEGADGLPQDMAAAARWYRKAAELGKPNAAAVLAQMYAQGVGVKRDLREAEKWRRRAEQDGER